MKSMSGIQGGLAPVPPTAAEPREPSPAAPAPSGSSAPEHGVTETAQPTREELEAAAAALNDQLAALPGGDREARLLYEEEAGTFVVEIRDRESGELIQQFPPEILLNQGRQAADLLGTVVDRRS
jgi:uncharacterized FlaG/YvyC family protein